MSTLLTNINALMIPCVGQPHPELISLESNVAYCLMFGLILRGANNINSLIIYLFRRLIFTLIY